MSTIWDWLIERQRTKQMAEWRRSVDQAEDMTIRIVNSFIKGGHGISLSAYNAVLAAIVELHRRQPGREIDLAKAEEAANRVLGELRDIGA